MMKKREWKPDIRVGDNVSESRRYSVWSLVMLFFFMSLSGWLWEVCLHLMTEGSLVNRGFLHGPWLPIYGSGSLLILVLLNRMREKPLLEFLSIMILCGCLEFGISWILELAYGGMKWWDYSDCFLNLDGRIYAKGILAFGVGGMVLVYFIALFLDHLFQRIPKKIFVSVCLILIFMFCLDLAYSGKNPNIGEGITVCE